MQKAYLVYMDILFDGQIHKEPVIGEGDSINNSLCCEALEGGALKLGASIRSLVLLTD